MYQGSITEEEFEEGYGLRETAIVSHLEYILKN